MEAAPILRQARIGTHSRRLGPVVDLPRPVQTAVAPAPKNAAPAVEYVNAEGAGTYSEVEIERRGLALAHKLLEAEREAAQKEGLRTGHAQGLEAAREQIAEQMRARQVDFEAVITALVQALQGERKANEAAAVELAMAAVARLLGEPADAQRIAAHVRSASMALHPHEVVNVRLAPRDLQVLQDAGIEPAALAPHLPTVQWVADPTVRGGCILQTGSGQLDARLQRQAEMLVALLNQVYGGQSAEISGSAL